MRKHNPNEVTHASLSRRPAPRRVLGFWVMHVVIAIIYSAFFASFVLNSERYPSATRFRFRGYPECSPGGWEAPSTSADDDVWTETKLIGRPARCLIKGRWAIEELDPNYNFRRAYSLGFVDDVENKYHLLPWLLASQDISLQTRKRRVYIDLGAQAFNSSLYWMLRNYPLDFTEIHAFEVTPGAFVIPDGSNRRVSRQKMDSVSRLIPLEDKRSMYDLPQWLLNRITAHNLFVTNKDALEDNKIDITRFIKEELRLTKEDAVVVKMDIEGAEWAILEEWTNDPKIQEIVDELFVEIHYQHHTMWGFQWKMFSRTREEAVELFAKLRNVGIAAHAWP